jgi:hypothetical protein
MMNTGFDTCFAQNEWAGLVNTDMHFGVKWLSNLVKHLHHGTNTLVNSLHITRTSHAQHIVADCGITEQGKFNADRFDELANKHWKEDVLEWQEGDNWRAINTMPYLFHRKYWQIAGPWELSQGTPDTPDVRFFRRCHNAGARFCKAHDSIVYHMEAAERSGEHSEKNQPGLEVSTRYAS